MNELLDELRTRLARSPLLAIPTREAILGVAPLAEPGALRDYLGTTLVWLEKLADSLPRIPELLTLARRIAALANPADVMAEFGLREFSPVEWEQASNRESEQARQLFCMANGNALLLLASSGTEETPTQRACKLWIRWKHLFWIANDRARALAILEDWLELGPDAYTHSTVRARFEWRFRDVFAETALRLVNALAESLSDAKRDPHQRVVLEAAFGLEGDYASDRETLQRHIEEYQAFWIRSVEESLSDIDVTTEERDAVLRGPGGTFRVVAEFVRALAWCRHRGDETEIGATLFGAYFGLGSDSLVSLTTLARRLADLGLQETKVELDSWLGLLDRCDQFDTLIATFEAAFRATAGDASETDDPHNDSSPNERWLATEATAAALLLGRIAATAPPDSPDRTERRFERIVRLLLAVGGASETCHDTVSGYGHRWASAVERVVADEVVLTLAFVCLTASRPLLARRLLEAQFGVALSAERAGEAAGIAFLAAHKGFCSNRGRVIFLVSVWSQANWLTDRRHEGKAVFDSIIPCLLGNASGGYRKLFEDLNELPVEIRELAVWVTTRTLLEAGNREGLKLCLRHLGITVRDLEGGRDGLAPRLAGRRSGARGEHLRRHVLTLAECVLYFELPPSHASSLIEAYLGIDDASFADRVAVGRWVHDSDAGPNILLTVMLSCAYVAEGRHDRAVLLLETLFGVEAAADYARFDWAAALGRFKPPDGALLRGGFVGLEMADALLRALAASGQDEKHALMLDALDHEDTWLVAVKGVRSPATLRIPFHMIDAFRTRAPRRCLDVTAKAIEHIRTRLRPLTGADRVTIAAACADLRRRIVTLGYDLAAVAADPREAEFHLRQFLCWDAELGQRLLLERMLAARADGEDMADTPEWDAGGEASGTSPRKDPPPPPGWPADGSLDAILARPVDDSRLADLLGGHRLLLRAGFASDGELIWALFDHDGRGLRIRRSGRTPDGIDARTRIQAAVADHDSAIHEAWSRARLEDEWPALVPRIDGVMELAIRGDDEGVRRGLRALAERLEEFDLHVLREECERRFPPSGHEPLAVDDWRSFWAARTPDPTAPFALGAALDAATVRFLGEVDAVWDTTPVAAALAESSERDLLVQVDDSLHGVPVAFLSAAGRFLFERVRSVHSTLSLTLDEWLRRLDREEMRASLALPDALLTVSHFAPGEAGARAGADALHAGHRRLAETHACEWHRLADRPPGTHAKMAAAIRRQRAFRVVSVCGHGNDRIAGVELGDGVWDGSSLFRELRGRWQSSPGCDVRAVEFLLQISCSIGRVRQSGWRDAEGFCVELAVHRARSVLAGLWLLAAREAAEYANTVAGNYLRLRAAARGEASRPAVLASRHAEANDSSASALVDALVGAALRARAVADARRSWLPQWREGRSPFGLNTVAAFELYGRG